MIIIVLDLVTGPVFSLSPKKAKEAIYGEEPSGLAGPEWGDNKTAKDGGALVYPWRNHPN